MRSLIKSMSFCCMMSLLTPFITLTTRVNSAIAQKIPNAVSVFISTPITTG